MKRGWRQLAVERTRGHGRERSHGWQAHEQHHDEQRVDPDGDPVAVRLLAHELEPPSLEHLEVCLYVWFAKERVSETKGESARASGYGLGSTHSRKPPRHS